jgi:arginine decarboxylase
MANQIVNSIKTICNKNNIVEPNIITEFGSFTVGESAATLYSVVDIKKQNDNEMWYMIDSSFITTLPDTWGIKQKFVLLAINQWDKNVQNTNLGGLSCDGDDYYNGETHRNQVYMPVIEEKQKEELVIGFFHTGAYQESLGGYGGIQHCLLPAPKHVIINCDDDGNIKTHLFAKEQNQDDMLKILGY